MTNTNRRIAPATALDMLVRQMTAYGTFEALLDSGHTCSLNPDDWRQAEIGKEIEAAGGRVFWTR